MLIRGLIVAVGVDVFDVFLKGAIGVGATVGLVGELFEEVGNVFVVGLVMSGKLGFVVGGGTGGFAADVVSATFVAGTGAVGFVTVVGSGGFVLESG